MWRRLLWSTVACLTLASTLRAQQSDQEIIHQLMDRLAESERRIQALEERLGISSPVPANTAAAAPAPRSLAALPETQLATVPADAPSNSPAAQAQSTEARSDGMPGHTMELPGGGPSLNIRGFFDFNFGAGSVANPLIFPVEYNGCMVCGNPPTPPHAGFQAGEFDLFMTSRLSDNLSFLAEMVFGADTTNEFSIDIERYQLTYGRTLLFSGLLL